MNHFSRSSGFSLIEVLVSLVILSISLLALAGLMTTTTRNNAFGGHLTEAATFAQDKLEEFRVTAWLNIVDGSDPNPIPGSTGLNYNRDWTVIGPAPPNDTQKTVTVTIRWNDRVDHSISFLTVITR
jgi:type IV pilus assembly protein PilV